MSAQLSFLAPVGSSCVQDCVARGAQIVAGGTKCEGAMLLCPRCYSESDLDPHFEGSKLVSFDCGCGHKFKKEDAALLTFKVTAKKRAA